MQEENRPQSKQPVEEYVPQSAQPTQEMEPQIQPEVEPITDSSFFQVMKNELNRDVKFSEEVMAALRKKFENEKVEYANGNKETQAKLEAGNFTSKIFNENHNSFGQKEAKVRINLARGTQYGHAYYNSWEESILDYAYWYSTYASKCKTEEQFYQLLDRVYAEDPLYSKKLRAMVEEEELKSKF